MTERVSFGGLEHEWLEEQAERSIRTCRNRQSPSGVLVHPTPNSRCASSGNESFPCTEDSIQRKLLVSLQRPVDSGASEAHGDPVSSLEVCRSSAERAVPRIALDPSSVTLVFDLQ